MRKEGLFLFIFMFLLINISSIDAQPPFVEEGANVFTEGFFVEFTPLSNYKIGDNLKINAHVFNISNGREIDNSTTVCKFSFFNRTGFHVISNVNMTFDLESEDWEYLLDGKNISTSSDYAYLVDCQDTTNNLGGFVAVEFQVTPNGFKIPNSGILYSTLLLIILLLNFTIFYIIFRLGSENHRDSNGEFIGVSLQKYVRMFLIGISYGLILLTLNLMNSVAQNLPEISQFAGIIGGLFLMMLSGAYVWSLIITLWIFITVIKDGNFIKDIKQKLDELERNT